MTVGETVTSKTNGSPLTDGLAELDGGGGGASLLDEQLAAPKASEDAATTMNAVLAAVRVRGEFNDDWEESVGRAMVESMQRTAGIFGQWLAWTRGNLNNSHLVDARGHLPLTVMALVGPNLLPAFRAVTDTRYEPVSGLNVSDRLVCIRLTTVAVRV